MAKFFIVVTIIIYNLFIVVSCHFSKSLPAVKAMEYSQLLDSLENDAILLDVRTPEEWKKGVIRKPLMFNYYEKDFKAKLLDLPRDKPIFVYCHSGYRSKKTQKFLLCNGFKSVFNLKLGIIGWTQNAYPLDSATMNKVTPNDKYKNGN